MKNRRLYIALIAVLIFALAFAYQAMTLCFSDDGGFAGRYRYYAGDGFNFEGLCNFLNHCKQIDNLRLANILCIPFIIWPSLSYAYKILFSIGIAIMILWSTCLAEGTRRISPSWLLLMWVALWFTIPWRGELFYIYEQSNYTISTLIMFLAFSYMFKAFKKDDTHAIIACAGLSMLLSAWHEGFGAALVGGTILAAIWRKGRIPWSWWAVIPSGILIMALGIFTSGVGARAMYGFSKMMIVEHPIKFFEIGFAFTLLLAALCAMAIFKQGRDYLRKLNTDNTFVLLFFVALAAWFIAAVTKANTRAFYTPQLLGTICWFILLRPWLKSLRSSRMAALVIFGTCCLIAHSAISLKWQYRLYSEHRAILYLLKTEPHATAYFDLTESDEVSFVATLRFPPRELVNEPFFYSQLRKLHSPLGVYGALVPTALKRTDLAEFPVINQELMLRSVDGVLYCERVPDGVYLAGVSPDLDIPFDYFNITLTDGSKMCHLVSLVPFIALDGREYYYVRPFQINRHRVVNIEPV